MNGHFAVGSVVVYDHDRWQIMEYEGRSVLLRRVDDGRFTFVKPYYLASVPKRPPEGLRRPDYTEEGSMSEDASAPTADELRRVAHHWQKVSDLACKHEWITPTPDSINCSSCGRPVRVLSDVQIEYLRSNT